MAKKSKAKMKARRETSAAKFPIRFSVRINLTQRRTLASMSDPGQFIRESINNFRKTKKGGKK